MSAERMKAGAATAQPISLPLFVAAVAIVLVGLPIFKWLATRLGLGEDVSRLVAELISFPNVVVVYGLLRERRLTLSFGLLPPGVVQIGEYLLPWYVLAVFGGLILAGVAQLGGLLGALLGGDIGSVLTGSTIVALIGSFVLGRWIGVRADHLVLVTPVLMAFIGRLVTVAADALLLGSEQYRAVFGTAPTGEWLTFLVISGSIVWLLPGMLGAWLGMKARQAAYSTYLVNRLDRADREAVLDLLYEEAQSRSPKSATDTGRAPPNGLEGVG